MRIAGHACGPVRLPLLDLTSDEEVQLATLMVRCAMPVAASWTERRVA